MMKEYIICAAIYYNDGAPDTQIHKPKNITTGVVITGRRHCNCYETLAMIYPDYKYKTHQTEGFLTSTNRFVDRYEAYTIAKREGQLFSGMIHDDTPSLTSEELY